MPAPFVDQPFTFTNPDGSTVAVRGSGNQFHADFETLDGFTVLQHPDSGFFEYATLAADSRTLAPSGVRVGRARPAGLTPHLRGAHPGTSDRLTEDRDGELTRWEQRRHERQTVRTAGGARSASLSAPTGDILGLCVLVDFPDLLGTITREQVDNFCNQPGYSEFGNKGSVFDYFHDVSEGKLRYRNLVVDYVTASHKRSFYTDEQQSYPHRAKQLVVEVLTQLKNRGFDFSDLSVDGRAVYALNIFYAGANTNQFRKGLWPHQSVLNQPFDITPNVPPPLPGVPAPTPLRYFSDYQITDLGTELTLGTFCHENGHMVCSFPDLYDRDDPIDSTGAGAYCLMAYGGALSDKNPAQISGYLKYTAGWASRVRDFTNGDVETIEAGTNDFLIHRKNDSEYFLLENRPAVDRDVSLPDSGLLIWHVDEHGNQRHQQMTAKNHYELSLEQADGLFELEHNQGYGNSRDLFGDPNQTFGEATTPNSNWWDGSRSGLDIVKISKPGQSMTVTTHGVRRLVIAGFGIASGGWRVDRHPRFLTRLAGHGGRNLTDLIAFGDAGVWAALNHGDGTFNGQFVLADFGYLAGGWRTDKHVRVTADLTGDGIADLVGFGDAGVWTYLNDGNGGFGTVRPLLPDFGHEGGWRVDKHVRLAADLTGDGRADLVGFGDDGVWWYPNKGDGSFGGIALAVADFGYAAGGWRVDRHLRLIADMAGRGHADLVGFGDRGVLYYPNSGGGTFGDIRLAMDEFGYVAGGWRLDRHPRFLSQLVSHADGRRYADIVGFYDDGVYASMNQGDGTFSSPHRIVAGFGTDDGWRVDRHPRFIADLTGSGTGDIVGFFDDGVWVAINNDDGTFQAPRRVIDDYGFTQGGWRVDQHPRFVTDLNGTGRADIIGIGNAGVFASLNNGAGTF